MSLFITYGIPAVIFVILFGVSLLIYKRIDSFYLKIKQKKEIKQKINIIDSIFSVSLAIVIVTPVIYIFNLLFYLFFPVIPKETVPLLIAVIYVSIACISDMVLFLFAWKWLKNSLRLSDLKIRKKNMERIDEKKKYRENVFYALLLAVFLFLFGILALYQASKGRNYIIEIKDGTPWDTWQLAGLGIALIGCALYLWRCAMKENKKMSNKSNLIENKIRKTDIA